jgi:hypothetical protein
VTTLIIVEDEATAAAMQRDLDPAVVRFEPTMSRNLTGARYTRVFIRYPSPNWFASTHTSSQAFQDWVRYYVTLRLERGGDFQFF